MKRIKYWVIDVDGTMTDAGIYYDENGNEMKKFSTKDAAGFFAIHAAGMKTIVLTGRMCKATERRMKEMKVEYLFQNVKDKKSFLEKFMNDNRIVSEELAYIGDDLNDLASMRLAGYVACPADSCMEVLSHANYISSKKGGEGAVRDIVEQYFRELGTWEDIVSNVYGIGV